MNQLPPQVRAILIFISGGTVLGLVFGLNRQVGGIILCGLVAMGCLLAGYKRLLKWFEKKSGKSMTGQMKEQSAGAPSGINEPAKRARLDDLKRNFDSGLEKFRSSDKDVYKLPWYLIVGEPGSGKTEAVRHCNVGFPPGLQDELQGVGGTINMNWWFTNHAVLLDTAGRLMFEEVKPGETSEWREFLGLLRKNRPNCPVNGLFLVIPVESLIRDTTDEISRKAGKIAQQLDLIQRSLDVRFPVYVLITKCDLLSGFREFFEDMSDPRTQHQMIGWSNPEPRDTPFRPELVTDHLKTVVERISKRRLGLLRDPAPVDKNGRRADEVDALFGLPHSLSLIGPRLRSYLETVFVAGEWSAKPLFLRGIYFTSAMREGAALDQELAQALGVSLDDLPEGKAWERERAYFLRDLFLEKAFPEKGLVTTATDTKAMLRKRQALLFGVGGLALATLLTFSFLGYRALKASVGVQSGYWQRAAASWENGVWHPIATHDQGGKISYMGDRPPAADFPASLIQFHKDIQELSTKPIEIPWVFKLLAKFSHVEGDRQKAQRILFEGSIVSPLVKEARRRMLQADASSAVDPLTSGSLAFREAEGLAALLQIEADVASHKSDPEALPGKFLHPLLHYVTNSDRPGDEVQLHTIGAILTWTYTKNPDGKWPPAWLSVGTSLPNNKPIQAGLDRLIKYASAGISTQEKNLKDIQQIADLLKAFRAKEVEMNSTAVSPGTRELVYKEMHQLFQDLKKIKESLDVALKAADEKSVARSERFTVTKSYEALIASSQTQTQGAFDLIDKTTAPYTAKPDDLLNTTYPIFIQVSAKLKEARSAIAGRISGGFSTKDIADLQKLDQTYLADFGNGQRLYEARWANYSAAHDQLFKKANADNLIATDWAPLTAALADIGAQRQSFPALAAQMAEPWQTACKYYLSTAEAIQIDAVVRAYIDQSRAAFDKHFHAPVVRDSGGSMKRSDWKEAERLAAAWKADLASDNYKALTSARKPALDSFLKQITQVAFAMSACNGNATVSLLGYSSSPDKSGLNHFRKVMIGGREYDTSTDRIEVNCSFSDAFSAEFRDYSVTPQKNYGFSQSIISLINKAGRGNGRVAISVDGYPIWLQVSSDRQPPDPEALVDKQTILTILR